MTTNQLFFALMGVLLALAGLLKWYIDAKIDPVGADVRRLIDYMMLHEGKIARLEERTKNI